jgi:hypothetical protein
MWTYSPESLSAWPLAEQIAAILWPLERESITGSAKIRVLERLDLTPEDLENGFIRELLETGDPQITHNMAKLAWLRRRDVPFYRLDELRGHLINFSDYLESQQQALLENGVPSARFDDSEWLDTGLTNLYPANHLIDELFGDGHAPIIRREILTAKVAVVKLLSQHMGIGESIRVSEEAVRLARGRRSVERLSELSSIEDRYFRNNFQESRKEWTFSGGHEDIIRLIAYCEKESTLQTFHSIKPRLEHIWPGHQIGRYVDIESKEQRSELNEVLFGMEHQLQQEEDFYRDFSTRVEVADVLKSRDQLPSVERDFIFRFQNKGWLVRWDGGPLTPFPDLIGMHYIEYLLSRPGESVNIGELDDVVRGKVSTEEAGLEITDKRAIQEQKARVADIDEELKKHGSHTSAERRNLKNERDAIVRHLSATTNRRGQPREVMSSDDSARVSVTNLIRYSKDKIQDQIPGFAAHLDRFLTTGKTCSYRPNPPISWSF